MLRLQIEVVQSNKDECGGWPGIYRNQIQDSPCINKYKLCKIRIYLCNCAKLVQIDENEAEAEKPRTPSNAFFNVFFSG
jgi:hypothetical protein